MSPAPPSIPVIKNFDELEKFTTDVNIAFMPGISYGGLAPRYGTILNYAKEDNYLYLVVHEVAGPPHVVYDYEADGNMGNVKGGLTIDYDKRNDLSSTVRAAVNHYISGDLNYDGLLFRDVDSYDVIFDPD